MFLYDFHGTKQCFHFPYLVCLLASYFVHNLTFHSKLYQRISNFEKRSKFEGNVMQNISLCIRSESKKNFDQDNV